MKKLFFVFLLSYLYINVLAQIDNYNVRMVVMEWNGEIIGNGDMDEVLILAKKPTAKEMRAAQKTIEKYDQVRWNVHKVYPYAVGVADLLKQAEKETQSMSSEAQKKAYIEQKQKKLFAEYQDDIEHMTTKQGKVLIKLIHRQTGNNAYSLIKDTKNGATAFFWNGVGNIFGINLKAEYDPQDDALIEQFARELDRGGYNIFWKEAGYRFKNNL